MRQSPPADKASTPVPATSNDTPFRRVHDICVAVANIDRAVAYYESVGIGPWEPLPPMTDLTELDGPTPEAFHDLTYRWTTIGDLQLQLVQPGAGRTPQGDFLAAHGEGVFHMGFAVESVDEAEADAAGRGLGVILRGRRADGSGFSYFDTYDAAGITLQVRNGVTPRAARQDASPPGDAPDHLTKGATFRPAPRGETSSGLDRRGPV
jgi:catechol 2,3-dioxygenase-like lactoylglutathione lyase family enzyme